MNVNKTGIYDDNYLEDLQLLQTGLSSLSDTLFNVVEGLPFQYANLTSFTILSNDYTAYKENSISYLTNLILILIIFLLVKVFYQVIMNLIKLHQILI
jgi:hypothetical protein